MIYIFSTRVDLCFEVHNMEKLTSHTSKVHPGGLVQLLRYIKDNKNLGLKYYSRIDDEHLYDLMRKPIINNEKQLIVFYD